MTQISAPLALGELVPTLREGLGGAVYVTMPGHIAAIIAFSNKQYRKINQRRYFKQ